MFVLGEFHHHVILICIYELSRTARQLTVVYTNMAVLLATRQPGTTTQLPWMALWRPLSHGSTIVITQVVTQHDSTSLITRVCKNAHRSTINYTSI